ncbi:hypothetical protein PsalMR5_01633 [Piscirickettsia salmonis]|uniref:hypothetical protein n=1 Tax=Piscirickettsia salmonis TaxID=1238 RepID=UPI0012BA8582|nr:hypothetical protein [Piscirickettsia salmonis]QGP54192.1 hypothetical protein PsalSR1_01624 [Piscirickettsia salmonis]QGP59912.1 hypothetical protein PsalBI1_02509 [Piscirickettsia salmonis]QGP63769.1 hypothetical protein PsalMR5_01633 [Piscirickettsia salmonis]
MQSLYHQNAKTALLFNKFAQNSIYLSSQQATRYFGKLPLRVVMRFVFFRSKLWGIRPLAIDCSQVNESITNLKSKVKKLPTDIRYGVVFTKRDLAPNLNIAESFEKVKEQLNLSSKPFVSSQSYVSTSLHDSKTSLDRKLKELIESEARAFKKIETALTSLEKHRDKKIKKSDSKYDKVTGFIQDTRQRINDFNSGNNQAFTGYQKHHQSMIKDLKDNRTTAKWWRAIAINFATLGVSLISHVTQQELIDTIMFCSTT